MSKRDKQAKQDKPAAKSDDKAKKDLDVKKDQAKDVTGGKYKYSDAGLKRDVRPL